MLSNQEKNILSGLYVFVLFVAVIAAILAIDGTLTARSLIKTVNSMETRMASEERRVSRLYSEFLKCIDSNRNCERELRIEQSIPRLSPD